MTANINQFNFYLLALLSLVLLACGGMVFVIIWDCQSSLKVKTDVQADMLQQLKETIFEQSKQLNQLQLQLQTTQSQPQVSTR